MKNSHRMVCLWIAGLLCMMTVSGCTSKGEAGSRSAPESAVSAAQSSGEMSVPDDASSSASDDVSDESKAEENSKIEASKTGEESSKAEESQSSEESVPAENIPVGRFTRIDPLKGSETQHLNMEMELYPYNDKLYLRTLAMSINYVADYENLEGYDPNILKTEYVGLIASVPYDTETNTFVFDAEDYKITVKYTDQHELEVTCSNPSYDYLAGTYVYQTAENKHPAPATVHDPKTPDGQMDAGIAENVRNKLGLDADAEITKEDCQKITTLKLASQSQRITSLDGIEYFSGLKELEVGDSTVRDISALAALPELESINFTNSMIDVIPDLSACKKLKKVEFINDFITDLSPLANIENLENVLLIDDQISSIAPLKDNHTIKRLTINNTCISDWESIGDNESLKKALTFGYKYYLEIQNKAKEIVSETVAEDMTDIEKQVRLAKYIEDFIEYDDTQEDPKESIPNGYFGIIRNTGVCENYAYAAKYLMTMAGLEVICCDSGGHAWNMIRLDGQWYEFDCTWDDDTDIAEWSWFNRSNAAISRNDNHWLFLPERMPYAEKDMPFTEYGRYGTWPD